MGTGADATLDAPAITPPKNGLLQSVQVIDHDDNNPDDSRWINGYRISPENCQDALIFDPCSGTDPNISLVMTDGAITANTVTLASATANFSANDVGKVVTSTSTGSYSASNGSTTIATTTFTSANANFNINDIGKVITSSATANATYANAALTQNSATVTSATANFTSADVGKTVTSSATAAATYADGVTNTDTSLVSATAGFTAADVGKTISGTNIPGGTTISSVTNATTIVLSAATTGTGGSSSFTITARAVFPTGTTTISSVTNSTTAVLSNNARATAASANFVIVARGTLQPNTTIASITNSTTVVLSAPAQATAASQSYTIPNRNPLQDSVTILSRQSSTSVTLSLPGTTTMASNMTFSITGRDVASNHNTALIFQPFIVEVEDTCSAFGFEKADYKGRALRALAARESKAVEKEFWSGALFPNNRHLADNTAGNVTTLNGGTALGPALGLGALIQAIADNNLGSGVIHARPNLVSRWASRNMLRWENGKVYTINGVLVIAGAGYLGTAPAGTAPTATTEWAYATGVPIVHRGSVQTFATEPAQTMDYSDNVITVRAQRAYSVAFNACAVLAVNVDITLTT